MICAMMMCKSICPGDSGSPLVDKVTNIQVGIASWGYGCKYPYYPVVFSNVAAVRDWIKAETGV